MRSPLLRFLGTVLGLWVATRIVPGFHIVGWSGFLLAALLLGIVNAILRPILVLLTLPITVVSFGLFLFVVNGITIALVAWLLPEFTLGGFGAAVLGAVVVGVTSWFAGQLVPHHREPRG